MSRNCPMTERELLRRVHRQMQEATRVQRAVEGLLQRLAAHAGNGGSVPPASAHRLSHRR